MNEFVNRLSSIQHFVCAAGFFVLWAAATAMLSVFLISIAWEIFSLSRFMDDDIAVLVGLPLGIVLGIFAALQSRDARRLHWFFIIGGPLLCAVGVILADQFFEKSEQLTGVLGPFSGMGEAIVGLFFVCLAIFGLLIFGIGLLGRLSDEIRT